MLSVGLLTGGYGEDELRAAGAFRVYRDAAELHESIVDEGERVEDSAQNRGANAMTTFEYNVDSKLLQVFKPPAHGK